MEILETFAQTQLARHKIIKRDIKKLSATYPLNQATMQVFRRQVRMIRKTLGRAYHDDVRNCGGARVCCYAPFWRRNSLARHERCRGDISCDIDHFHHHAWRGELTSRNRCGGEEDIWGGWVEGMGGYMVLLNWTVTLRRENCLI